jgi:hypothetical protein
MPSLDAIGENFSVGDEQVIANQLHALTQAL